MKMPVLIDQETAASIDSDMGAGFCAFMARKGIFQITEEKCRKIVMAPSLMLPAKQRESRAPIHCTRG